jgi:hypothetical protein
MVQPNAIRQPLIDDTLTTERPLSQTLRTNKAGALPVNTWGRGEKRRAKRGEHAGRTAEGRSGAHHHDSCLRDGVVFDAISEAEAKPQRCAHRIESARIRLRADESPISVWDAVTTTARFR